MVRRPTEFHAGGYDQDMDVQRADGVRLYAPDHQYFGEACRVGGGVSAPETRGTDFYVSETVGLLLLPLSSAQ